MNCFLIEWLPTKFHRVPIRKAQVMAIWKFRYRQFFGKSGWSVKKWLDRYQMLQPHADAWKGPAYQIIAWSVRNCQSYPIFSLLVGRSVGGVARPQFFLFCSPKTWQEHPTYVPEHIADISETKIENWLSSTILMNNGHEWFNDGLHVSKMVLTNSTDSMMHLNY